MQQFYCSLYDLLTDKHKCIHRDKFVFYATEKDTYLCDCPRYKDCCLATGQPYRKYVSCNTVVNNYGDGRLEYICFKDPFMVLKDHANLIGHSTERKFQWVFTSEGDLLLPVNPDIEYVELLDSIKAGSKRARENYWGYALCNHWHYFATFTVSKEKCNRYNDLSVKKLWQLFRKRLYQFDKYTRYLCVPERHEDGALHFHCLIATDRPFTLSMYFDKGEQQYSKTGAPLWTIDLWDFGLCTLAVLPENDNQCAVVNYLIEYNTKQSNLGYGVRRFMRSQNLENKEKETSMHLDTENQAAEMGLKRYKELDNMIVYRNFNMKEE
jgi:hypothetical protein